MRKRAEKHSGHATALRKTARLPTGEEVSAEFLVRYPLINHLEQHVEQLERALG